MNLKLLIFKQRCLYYFYLLSFKIRDSEAPEYTSKLDSAQKYFQNNFQWSIELLKYKIRRLTTSYSKRNKIKSQTFDFHIIFHALLTHRCNLSLWPYYSSKTCDEYLFINVLLRYYFFGVGMWTERYKHNIFAFTYNFI